MPIPDTSKLNEMFQRLYNQISPYLPSESDVNATLDGYDQATRGIPNPLQYLDEAIKLPLLGLTAFKKHGVSAEIARKSKMAGLIEQYEKLYNKHIEKFRGQGGAVYFDEDPELERIRDLLDVENYHKYITEKFSGGVTRTYPSDIPGVAAGFSYPGKLAENLPTSSGRVKALKHIGK